MNQVQTINKKKKRKGFTLIELIIVLAVMAIIAAIAIPNFAAVRDNSKNKADVQSAETIKRTVLMLVSDGAVKAGTEDKVIKLTDGKDVDVTNLGDEDDKDAVKEALKEVKAPQGDVFSVATGKPVHTKGAKAAQYQIKITKTGDIVVETIAAASN